MKYVITGGAGHISKPLAEKLLEAGHQVTVIGRSAENLKPLTDKGATAAIGSVEDIAFLTQAFTGADAVYTMVPPNFAAPDWKGYIGQIGKNYVAAIQASGIRYVVNLSSVGAHMPEGCGPVSGLYRVEQALNQLNEVHVRHLRPAFFYQNFLANVGMVQHMNIIGGNYGDANTNMTMVHTNDIAEVAAEELQHLAFTGHSVRYIVSDERTAGDVASALGAAIGKPELPWVSFTDEQALGGMLQAGLPEEVAKNYVEMGTTIRSGAMMEDYYNNRPETLAPTKLEDFAREFAAVYHQSAPAQNATQEA
jgi:uncharacterized protein YbjT (DUF2867 family)